MKRNAFLFVILLITTCTTGSLHSQRAADPDPKRYAEAMAQFAEADAKNPVPKGGIVFVGSSSIRRMDLSTLFPDLKAINRGFGGSQISDVNHYIEETVLKYEPSLTILYCGGNDLWARKPAIQVLEDFRVFCEKLFERLPNSKLIVLAARPSPRRESIFETELAFNYLVEMEAKNDERITFLRGSSDRYFDEKGNYFEDFFHEDRIQGMS